MNMIIYVMVNMVRYRMGMVWFMVLYSIHCMLWVINFEFLSKFNLFTS